MGDVCRIKSHPEYKASPFRVNDIEWVTPKSRDPDILIDKSSGEIKEYERVKKQVIVPRDTAIYTKVFRAGLKVLANIGRRGTVMLYHIQDELRPGSIMVEVDRVKAERFHKSLSGPSYYVALTELLENGVIARSNRKNWYYINPNVMFNGDRRKLAKRFDKKDV